MSVLRALPLHPLFISFSSSLFVYYFFYTSRPITFTAVVEGGLAVGRFARGENSRGGAQFRVGDGLQLTPGGGLPIRLHVSINLFKKMNIMVQLYFLSGNRLSFAPY